MSESTCTSSRLAPLELFTISTRLPLKLARKCENYFPAGHRKTFSNIDCFIEKELPALNFVQKKPRTNFNFTFLLCKWYHLSYIVICTTYILNPKFPEQKKNHLANFCQNALLFLPDDTPLLGKTRWSLTER